MPSRSQFTSNEEYAAWFREYRKKNRKKMRAYYREYNREWRKRNGYENEKNWADKNPHKVKAQAAAQRAIRAGKIKRLPCEVCKARDVVAHHDDYKKPLEVRFLCKAHHRQVHYRELKWEEAGL